MAPPSKGQQAILPIVVLFSEVKMYCIYTFGDIGSVLCREVVPFLEGPLTEILLYTIVFHY